MAKYTRRQEKPSIKDRRPKAKPVKDRIKLKSDYQFVPPEAAGLTDKQRRFCDEYIIDLNGTQAAIRAGYSKTTASTQASVLLSSKKCIKYVTYLKVQRARRLEVSQDRIVQELARIAYHDKRTFYDREHNAIPLQEITDDQQTAIQSIKFRTVQVEVPREQLDGSYKMVKVPVREVSSYQFYDRRDALRMLGHHCGMSLDRPSEHPSTDAPDKEAISFEQLMRKLDAKNLEKFTKLLLLAQTSIDEGTQLPTPTDYDDSDEDIPADHWSKKAEAGQMQ